MQAIQTIDEAELDSVTGGLDWGAVNTAVIQGVSCAGGGALVGSMIAGPTGAAVGAVGAGAACATTSYLAARQQAQPPEPQR